MDAAEEMEGSRGYTDCLRVGVDFGGNGLGCSGGGGGSDVYAGLPKETADCDRERANGRVTGKSFGEIGGVNWISLILGIDGRRAKPFEVDGRRETIGDVVGGHVPYIVTTDGNRESDTWPVDEDVSRECVRDEEEVR